MRKLEDEKVADQLLDQLSESSQPGSSIFGSLLSITISDASSESEDSLPSGDSLDINQRLFNYDVSHYI